ncbi:hypothetical protein [Thomasclavelia spiroformis]|uniref:hypothetical protein n=1 Tax=Thomasclavelia spiroformis TaxID=29348 RepID=UPI00255B7256|nr:hypothetical protein [Thomasclavelia spiroformis]
MKKIVIKSSYLLDVDALIKEKKVHFTDVDKYLELKNAFFSKDEYEVFVYDGNFYYKLINPKIPFVITDIDEENLYINFDYFEKNDINDEFDIDSISFTLKYDEIKFISDEEKYISQVFKNKKFNISFEDNIQKIKIEGKKISKEYLYNIIKEVLIFNYFLCGKIPKMSYPINLKNETHYIEIYGGIGYDDKKSSKYSEFSIVKLKLDEYIKFLFYFSNDFYSKFKVQLDVFMSTQFKNGIGNDQNVAILLNSLEGFIKKQKIINTGELKIFDKDKKNKIVDNIISKLTEYCNSEEFDNYIRSLDINSEKLIKEIKNKIINNNGRINECTFDEMLDLSKKVSKKAERFVKESKIEHQFWKKCKNHRNFFAHLTDKRNNGFDGFYKCFHAMHILSTYYILIILATLKMENYAIDDNINKRAKDIHELKDKFDYENKENKENKEEKMIYGN